MWIFCSDANLHFFIILGDKIERNNLSFLPFHLSFLPISLGSECDLWMIIVSYVMLCFAMLCHVMLRYVMLSYVLNMLNSHRDKGWPVQRYKQPKIKTNHKRRSSKLILIVLTRSILNFCVNFKFNFCFVI